MNQQKITHKILPYSCVLTKNLIIFFIYLAEKMQQLLTISLSADLEIFDRISCTCSVYILLQKLI